MYYPCSENKGADQLRAFVFAYADCWFSHGAAHLLKQIDFKSLVDQTAENSVGYFKH